MASKCSPPVKSYTLGYTYQHTPSYRYLHMERIGLGGSCHWCTEAIFQSLKGVTQVEQGWIEAAGGGGAGFSEAVLVTFDAKVITLNTLIAVHLHTHSCTANHAMRAKYRSAVYTFTALQQQEALACINALQPDFAQPIITKVLPYAAFKLNKAEYLNYYYSNPQKPFCQNMVNPKLKTLMALFAGEVKPGLSL